ncbi:MAG: hypothetical protein RMJ33_00290 [Saprospiraceae bacterium]|nr:hypothetical protein [Saprospiraceae bacterium]
MDLWLRHQRVLIGALVGVAGLIFYFLWQKRPYAPLHAASEQAAVVLYAAEGMAGLNAVFPSENKEANQRHLLRQYRAAVKGISALLTPEAAHWWASQPQAAIFSLHANDSLQPLLVLDAGEALDVKRILGVEAGAWSVYRFKGHELYEHQGRRQWIIAIRRNLMLASRFSYLVEEALTQLERRDGWWAEQAARTPAPVVVVARPSMVVERARTVLTSGWGGVAEALAAALEAVAIGLWPDSSEVVVRTTNTDAPAKALSRAPMSAILPDHVALYTWHTTRQPGEALTAFAQPGRDDAAFRQYILPWCGHEAALVWLEPQAGSATFDGAWVCSVRDEGQARRLLEKYGAHSGMVRRYRYHAFEIRQFLDPSLLAPLLFRGVEAGLQNPACAVFDGYAVFAPSAAALELWLDKYIVSQTLSNNPDYLALLSRQPPEGRWALWFNGRYLPLLAQKMLAPPAEAVLAEIRYWAAKGLTGLDFQPEGRGVWRAKVVQQRIQRPGLAALSLMWKTSLPAAVIGTPQWIAPAEGESVPFVIAQDAQGQLHCLAAGGQLRWSKALGQPIRSSIHLLEGLPGDRWYYVFNTSEALWMLDDQGQEVRGFPLRLQSPATNGVIVAPLESARRYGLFVACANGNVYGFDAYGRPLPGWNPKAGAGRVERPLLHFTWSNKDYIAALSTQGRLMCADRAGNKHFADAQLQGSFTTTPPLRVWEKNIPYLLCINDAGHAFRCSLTGQITEYALGWDARQRHWGAASGSPKDAKNASVALVSGQHVVARPLSGTHRPIEWRLPAPADTLWAVGDADIGVLCRSPRQVFLLKRDGRLAEGFPLGGNTPFDLLSVSAQERWLVVGYDTEVYAYRLTGQ